MEENLVIVESPAKARTIERLLGNDFQVISSFGHIRDLSKKNFGINLNNNYQPEYIISEDKKKIVAELKKQSRRYKLVWLASDEDREGEAIAWHLAEVLELQPGKTRRIVFHEITKNAIEQAVKNPRDIDMNLVKAQQARRVLDRLVGFELSPVLWKKVKPALSAGRVQSVAVRLLVEREREINDFKSSSSFRLNARFKLLRDGKEHQFDAELQNRLKTKEQAREFLESCFNADFRVSDLTRKPTKKSPAPPFTTSTLQQEASRKFGFSVSQTMTLAQRLYESGQITYMRTDSVNLSSMAIASARDIIMKNYGEKYSRTRKFQTRTKGAQEAHEAIRPSYLDKNTIQANANEKKLYELIWKRTVASQMSEALLEKTTVKIAHSNSDQVFVTSGEVVKFDGFLKLYTESTEEEKDARGDVLLPPLKKGDSLNLLKAWSDERFTQPPPRYTEASLVKKLEELGIGRPSTYAPTISTIQNRGYAVKEDRPGTSRDITLLELSPEGKVNEKQKQETQDTARNKIFPTDIGMIVNDFLVENFPKIMDYNFTATVEKEFDEIASGRMEWTEMMDKFYVPFHQSVESTLKESEKQKGERFLGNDPETGKPVVAKIGRYGPIIQIGSVEDEEKPRFASLLKGQSIQTISLEEALNLFRLPRKLGSFEDEQIVAGIGKYGPYIRHKGKFVSLRKDADDPLTIDKDTAIERIMEKRARDKSRVMRSFDEDAELSILRGRYGPYIKKGDKNYRIPKKMDPEKLSYQECLEIIERADKKNAGPGKSS